MSKNKNSITHLLIFLINIFFINCINKKYALDTVFNIYKSGKTESHSFLEISNTTWKEYFVSEKLKKLKKLVPCHVNNDNELDLFVEDSSARLIFINNIRGTSQEFTHEKLSSIYISDFVLSKKLNDYNDNNGIFILATNQNRDKIIKYKKNPYYNPLLTNDTEHDTKKYWEEKTFVDIKDSTFASLISISSYIKIKSTNLFEIDNNQQMLIINMENINTHKCRLLKLKMKNEKIISSYVIGSDMYDITILGLFDINNDGLIDILYMDSYNSLYIYLNQDPNYYSIEIAKIKPTKIANEPRIFIYDANKDLYPDIIVGDTDENSVALLLNPGKNYWKKVIKYFDGVSEKINNYNGNYWDYLLLIDTKYLQNMKLKDFTIVLTDHSKKLTFEIVAIYDNKVYWFIEKENGYHSQYLYHYLVGSLNKCNIFIEKLNHDDSENGYDFILDVDLNNDNYPEFLLYSSKEKSLLYIQRSEKNIISYGWSQRFWIYLMIGIYSISTILGIAEFYRLKTVNEHFSKMSTSFLANEESKKNIELGKIMEG